MRSASVSFRVAICFLLCAAHAGAGEASYVRFQVPGAQGTYPKSVNNSMAVTGYYYASATVARGFIRQPDGTFTTFDAVGSTWTEPESINDSGEITGYYLATVQGVVVPQGFIRYEDGRILTFNPPCTDACGASLPLSINAFGEVAGAYPYQTSGGAAAFTRLRDGSFTTYPLVIPGEDVADVVATAINGSGTLAGVYLPASSANVESFKVDAGGYLTAGIFVPAPGSNGPYTAQEGTVAEGINASGAIVGWYAGCNQPCTQATLGGFVLSPQGEFTLFNPPGTLVVYPAAGLSGLGNPFVDLALIAEPHRLSINQPGSVTGSYIDAGGAQHGFLRNPYGTVTSFDPPKGHQTTSTSINDSGVITGTYLYNGSNPTVVGFLRIPQPQP